MIRWWNNDNADADTNIDAHAFVVVDDDDGGGGRGGGGNNNDGDDDDDVTKAWISNHIRHKVWDQITFPLQNFYCSAVEIGILIS